MDFFLYLLALIMRFADGVLQGTGTRRARQSVQGVSAYPNAWRRRSICCCDVVQGLDVPWGDAPPGDDELLQRYRLPPANSSRLSDLSGS